MEIIIGTIVGASVTVLFLIYFSFFKVEEGNIATISSFGKARRARDGKLKLWYPGLYSKLPWEKVKEMSVMEKKLDLSDNENPFLTMAHDGTTLSLQASVRLQAVPEYAESILYGVDSPMDQIRSYLSCILRSEIANFGNQYDPGDVFIQLRNQQNQMRKSFEDAAGNELLKNYGVKLLGLDLVDITPPQELANAMNSVQTARADSESMIARAHAYREKRLYSAKINLEISKKEAEAAEKEMLTIVNNLAVIAKKGTIKDYVNRRILEVYHQSKLSVIKQEQS